MSMNAHVRTTILSYIRSLPSGAKVTRKDIQKVVCASDGTVYEVLSEATYYFGLLESDTLGTFTRKRK